MRLFAVGQNGVDAGAVTKILALEHAWNQAVGFWNPVVVTGLYISKGVENGKPYVHRGRFVDTWAFRDGTWLCVAIQATPSLH